MQAVTIQCSNSVTWKADSSVAALRTDSSFRLGWGWMGEETAEAGASEMSRTWPGRRYILMTVFAEAHRCVRARGTQGYSGK